jgi:hypothetical protein
MKPDGDLESVVESAVRQFLQVSALAVIGSCSCQLLVRFGARNSHHPAVKNIAFDWLISLAEGA